MGQTNNGISGYLENDRLILVLEPKAMDSTFLFVRHDMGQIQVKWTQHQNVVLLIQQGITTEMGELIPIDLDYKIKERVLGQFSIIKQKSKEGSLAIDATELFLQNKIKWFRYDTSETVLRDRSLVLGVDYEKNETIVRTKRTVPHGDGSNTTQVDFSFYVLPVPMRPRLLDHRMGFHMDEQWDIRREGNYKACITRWRLVKKHPEQELSEPLEPITFYFDRTTPDKWKPYIKAGLMEWAPAFEAAGFKNAIEVRDLPDSISEGNSVNRSLIRWVNFMDVRGGEEEAGSTVREVTDSRSGEILKADILIRSSPQSLSEEYLVRCAPMDRRAQQYPFPDDLLGELFQFVTAHEAGHAFGLMDANYGEYGYPIEKMRDAMWLKEMGHTPSVMTYARHNYVAQPEDSIPPQLLIQKVGPMDNYQIRWGYSVFPRAEYSEDELSLLDTLIRERDSIPWFQFNSAFHGKIGPDTTNEVVDNNDPVKSTELGLKNIGRVLELLPKLTGNKRDNALLEHMYGKTLELWHDQMRHVISLIGGYTIHYRAGFENGDVFEPISRNEQERAMAFLVENAFEVPIWLGNPDFKGRLRFTMGTDRLMIHQMNLLTELLEIARLRRMENMEQDSAYENLMVNLVNTLQSGLFSELRESKVKVPDRRKNIQDRYIALLGSYMQAKPKDKYVDTDQWERLPSGHVKSVCRLNLQILGKEIEALLEKSNEGPAAEHWKNCLKEIKTSL